MNQRMRRPNRPSNVINESYSSAANSSGFSRGEHHNGGMSGCWAAIELAMPLRSNGPLSRWIRYLKFIAVQDDASFAEVCSGGYWHRLRFGACNV